MTGETRPAFEPADPDYERRTRASFGRQGAMAHLGATLGRVEPGYAEIVLPYRRELSQQHGCFHAGIVAAGRVIRAGRTITVAQFDVHVEKAGRSTHCATGLQTIMRIVGRAGVQG